eukprot:CAMPEP_0174960968 /NCGR_PEP_ID=MMETSP0004_2-20121128/3983_1 /TAXON_ID=420556 /ORGANISM="Ochromonas sp., Strain CCMP1393" /LENGTH=180 /DNA_ID=CAMNT_0016209369 /DNA_START=70 /DNA_END=612 /DNA_ORIENTATION=+
MGRACGVIPLRMKSESIDKSEQASDVVNLLTGATLLRNIGKDEVTRAITALESTVVEQRRPLRQYSSNVKDLKGEWELVFSSLLPFGYFPVKEICDFFAFSISNTFGPLSLGTVRGTSEVLQSSPYVEISFTGALFTWGGIVKVKLPSDKTKSYKFYHIDTNIAVARSSAGGYTLMKRIA